ncbi:MAG: 3-phosphoadenosine 5-phosphate phosphatase [Actinomycetota bacterium]|jgi:3'(2'), 5'-bisphosphate nucleotidase
MPELPAAALDDHALAAVLAEQAGQMLLELRETLVLQGADQRTIKDAGDRQSHLWLLDALSTLRPNDAVLSEEGRDSRERLGQERVWIIDPLDGTREYGEGRSDWAVHVALSVDGKPAIGAVAQPGLNAVYATGGSLQLPERDPEKPITMVVSRSRAPMITMMVARELDARYIEMGSAGAKSMAVVRGEADIYLHAGGQYEWDNCAPAAVALAAGLHASRIDGWPLTYNHPDPWSPDLLICRPEYAESILRYISLYL